MTDRIAASIVIERTYKATAEELWALWTTSEGFASWWGPQDFRADVHRLEARLGGALHYDMVADTPEMVAEMKAVGQPPSHETRGTFTEFRPYERLELTHIIDFLPGVAPYDSTMLVEFFPLSEGRVRMVVTLSPMHDAAFTEMQREGFTSQLTKLDRRYGWEAPGTAA
ncbi:Uncharacterized conserved protein YndB, AHSA1/START domain [Sphingomonas laterariae]|uniref:Uncharacterized conserved protein YndB, AHSA1/START domain n=1 Tax=Edaphosphingomonas laterariae TaxID=861865 RepID=A0A239J2A1_9SPHN|nr:SRPBCC domain-containing protein [Sphingomonas laterariae]SNT00051.1 Uncharacterized conserved protein YndB, AHSA1/START domain [Sphingomonas laterariae]